MSTDRNPTGGWEQRWHPLRREWVVYAAHRNQRPWSGSRVHPPESSPEYDPECSLCPGNLRAGGIRNPRYEDVFVFDNDFPVVSDEAPPVTPKSTPGEEIYRKSKAEGVARVLCYDPRHNVGMADLSDSRAAKVFETWREQCIDLSKKPVVRHILIFENRGEIVGVSNPHPHCQIYAVGFTFSLVERELEAVRIHREASGENLFEKILEEEKRDGRRIVSENEHAVAFVPFFARYAYEVLIFPKRRHADLTTCTLEELQALAVLYREIVRRYDALFGMPFPYVTAIHQAPFDGGEHADYHFHLLIQPPLRQPGLQKYLAGPEIGGGNFMADTIPEETARQLKEADLSNYGGG